MLQRIRFTSQVGDIGLVNLEDVIRHFVESRHPARDLGSAEGSSEEYYSPDVIADCLGVVGRSTSIACHNSLYDTWLPPTPWKIGSVDSYLCADQATQAMSYEDNRTLCLLTPLAFLSSAEAVYLRLTVPDSVR